MPNSVSAKKRLRQSIDRRAHNRTIRSNVRGQIKKLRGLIAAGDAAASETEYRITVKKLDQASAKNILHANAASRLKSRLAAAVKAMKNATPKAAAK